ncbi:MAG: hypothetical protein NT038_10350 [Euryarchaeota archaeon]|nr:hypothetical protein [Euryarchaeota archaeon]
MKNRRKEGRRNSAVLILGVLLFILACALSGCTEKADHLIITIVSYSPNDVEGYITVDDINFQNVSLGMFNTTAYNVSFALLPDQTYHHVTVSIQSVEGGDVWLNASCDNVTESASFMVSVEHHISLRNYK